MERGDRGRGRGSRGGSGRGENKHQYYQNGAAANFSYRQQYNEYGQFQNGGGNGFYHQQQAGRGGYYGGAGRGGTRTQNQRVGQWAEKVQNGVLPPPAVMGTTVVGCGDHGGVAAAAASHPQSRDPKILTDMKQLQISDSPPCLENKLVPMRRPDRGGLVAVRPSRLLVNHFPVMFNSQNTIMHYDVTVKQEVAPGSRSAKKAIPKSDLNLIREKLFSDKSKGFPMQMTAYDGEKNIFSAVMLPTGSFKVELSEGEDRKSRNYTFTIKLVNELKLSKLKNYLSGNLMIMPRDILQGLDLVMKENPSRHRISIGRSTYSKEFRREDDLRCGLAAFKGFQQSLKPTSQGLALCLDYSVLAFRKRMPVLDFLREHLRGFVGASDIRRLKRDVLYALKGLKVNVTHRITKQKYTISGLTDQNTKDLTFPLEDPEGKNPPTRVSLVTYFKEKYGKEILHKDIPCLDVGKNHRKNYVPLEFCVLVEGQRYPKENLDKDAALLLKRISLAPALERKNTICQMVQADDAPCGGEFIKNFGMDVVKNMTSVVGRIISPPDLKLATSAGKIQVIKVDKEKCQWNLLKNSVVDGKSVDHWALIDFSLFDRYNRLDKDNFVRSLRVRCKNLGIEMAEPHACRATDMHAFTDVNRLRELLETVIDEARRKSKGQLQIVLCVMSGKHPGYKYLKWVSETQIGVITQCCLSSHANKGNDQYLANLALKINAKLGGSNVELNDSLPCLGGGDPVMFVGADVNHPGAWNMTCPSIAAVVASINWPTPTRYAARVSPQTHRKEKILNFGAMCLDLLNTFAKINNAKPKKIVVFRDGVSEGQFDMVLNEELQDLKMAIYEENYRPTITFVVAQKRHHTRLFLEDQGGDGRRNISPGTVVDTVVVHPFEFDFYLCSHYGSLGTSKPTHYYVLSDEHNFTSDQLQKLIYQLCFTFARCTKPVSLVPPVYYADLVAYRGRMFQEVLMEMQSPHSASSTTSFTSSTSSSATSFDDTFYKLHAELQNIMFFI
ncbi:Argonaute protein group [Heracleum sosnowskyi]|uniref:Argonaute protein group n=1 Tax=Heracleum sosnowskyi TaxID=360622 RepID=A0AAD8I166_9APIA|nr:Argonaute protein group [Heracleum sosnowskyi]